MGIFDLLPESIIYFSKICGTPIFTNSGEKIGVLRDFFVDFEDIYPIILGLKLKNRGQDFYIAWEEVETFSNKKIVIKNKHEVRLGDQYPLNYQEHRPPRHLLSQKNNGRTVNYPALGKIILDRQVVDTHGKKVVRVNDIHFIKVGQNLRVTHVCIGFKGMLRRLGHDKPVEFLLNTFFPNNQKLKRESLISWKNVHVIPEKNHENLKLNISNEDLQGLHPADLADILEDLDTYGREQLFQTLDPEIQAKTLSEVEEDIQLHLINADEPENAASIIENMDINEAVDLLQQLSQDENQKIISLIKDKELQKEISALLFYRENSAGGIMSTEAFEVPSHFSKQNILDKIASEESEDFGSINDIFVINEKNILLGHLTLKELLRHKENVTVKDIMATEDLKYLPASTQWKEVAEYMSKYNLINVPICDKNLKLLGVISVDDILPWLLDE